MPEQMLMGASDFPPSAAFVLVFGLLRPVPKSGMRLRLAVLSVGALGLLPLELARER